MATSKERLDDKMFEPIPNVNELHSLRNVEKIHKGNGFIVDHKTRTMHRLGNSIGFELDDQAGKSAKETTDYWIALDSKNGTPSELKGISIIHDENVDMSIGEGQH